MELSSFSENIVTEVLDRNGESVELRINIDAVVPEYFEVIGERLKPTMKKLEALVKQHRELNDEIDKHIANEEKRAKAKGKKEQKPPKPIDYDALLANASDIRKRIAEIDREISAERLTCPVTLPNGSTTCLLKGWDLTENGMVIEANKANLLRLPPKAVEAIYKCVEARLETVKKKVDAETEETSESMPNSSKGLRVVGQSG